MMHGNDINGSIRSIRWRGDIFEPFIEHDGGTDHEGKDL